MGKDGHNLKRVTRLLGGDDSQPAISPHPKWIAFVHGGSAPGIFVVKDDGSQLRRLTSDPSDADPAFLANGKRILFSRGSFPNRDIFIMRFNGHHERSLIDAISLRTRPPPPTVSGSPSRATTPDRARTPRSWWRGETGPT